ncbi:MAG: nuclear transport factor 2 family protein [Janthinobacterium lividum]
MPDTRTLITKVYAAFNRRDIDGALDLMNENVSWPKASEGGYVVGKDEIRAYWTRQWSEFDPHVEPVDVTEDDRGMTSVSVHQVVKSLDGAVLSDSEVWHVYTVSQGLIDRMELGGSDVVEGSAPSAAFARH